MRQAWVLALGLGLGCGSSEQGKAAASEPARSDTPSPSASAGPSADASATAPNAKAEPSTSAPSKAERIPEPKLLEPIGELAPTTTMGASDLPPTPLLGAPEVPDVYADGAWSITGLRRDPEPRFAEGDTDREIEVLAYVQEIYAPPPCSDPAVCAPVKQPHLWAVDAPGIHGHKRAMMVVNYAFAIPEWDAAAWKGVEPIVLEVGKQYRFRGKFRQFSDTGFSDPRGLLEFGAVQQTDPATGIPHWVTPPGAPWHPLNLMRVEEERRRLEARVKGK